MKLSVGFTSFSKSHGYGRIEEPLVKSLAKAGATILQDHEFGWDYRLLWGYPRAHSIGATGRADDVILHTMWERPELPKHWPDLYNRFGLLWVPSRWCRDMFIRHGITTPIMVSSYGVDEDEFPNLVKERESHDHPFTFLAWGHRLVGRKGPRLVLEAFGRLKLKDAKLVLKIRDCPWTKIDGVDNVEIVPGFLGKPDLLNLLASCDVLVYPHRGEGLGLIPLECGRTGLPGIVSDYTGTTEYIDDGPFWKLKMGTEVSQEFPVVEPDADHLAELMLWCYEHQDEVRKLGRSVADYVDKEWTWEAAGRRAYQKILELTGG